MFNRFIAIALATTLIIADGTTVVHSRYSPLPKQFAVIRPCGGGGCGPGFTKLAVNMPPMPWLVERS